MTSDSTSSAASTMKLSKLSYSDGTKELPSDAPHWAIKASERLKQRRSNGYVSSVDVPSEVKRVLLHSCCAPCSGAMVEEMCSSPQLDEVVVFFYNPNIHPRKEYEIRKTENKRYCEQLGIDFVDCDYDADNWYERMKGMEFDPERGRRCTECFDMRMERTALYAHENGFQAIATTNATSRWKDANQVDSSGHRAAARYEGLKYWHQDWQTDEMTLRKYEISASEKFYKQEYCGCSFSLRDSNDWRKANGLSKIKIGGEEAGIGERYFTDPLIDAAEESQDVVDEFFAQANEIAEAAGNDVAKRREALKVYKDRRKSEATDGVVSGLNNW